MKNNDKINTVAELKIRISKLEFEHEVQGELLKEQYLHAYDSLKPASLIKETLLEISSPNYVIDNLVGATLGLLTNFVSSQLTERLKNNPFRKIISTAFQFGVANFVAQHPDSIKNVGKFIMKSFFQKKENGQRKAETNV
jgi:hypothetical protein